jgi:hypothetical protein
VPPDRGYSRFQLTGEQFEFLHYLRAGSAERHGYLHSLASNPVVLDKQAL